MSLDVHLFIDVDTGGPEPHRVYLYDANVTHNLNKMAEALGIYQPVWRPDEAGITCAAQLIPHLSLGIDRMIADPNKYKLLNPENGWGTYEGFLRFLESYLAACKEHPKASVEVSR